VNRYRLSEILLAIFLFFGITGSTYYFDGNAALVLSFSSEDPVRWESDIVRLESKTVPSEAILFLGSSSIVRWDSLSSDMAPLAVINRGFGGAKMNDVVYYADRLIEVDAPIAVVIFVGTNDIHPGASKEPRWLVEKYRELVELIRARISDIPIYYIGITPSIMRWDVWDIAQRTNELIEDFSSSDPLLYFIDTSSNLLINGKLNGRNYVPDGLHLSKNGYEIWASQIGGVLKRDLL